MIPYTQFRYVEITSPTYTGLISTADAKHFAYIEDTGDAAFDTANDSLVDALIVTARKYFENYTGKRILHTKFRATLDCTPHDHEVYMRDVPIVSVDKVFGLNDDATESVADASDYAVDLNIGKVISDEWPTGDRTLGSFNIEYTSGLFDLAANVEDDVKTCLKMMVSHWYEHREAASVDSIKEVPMQAKMIMNNYKTRRF